MCGFVPDYAGNCIKVMYKNYIKRTLDFILSLIGLILLLPLFLIIAAWIKLDSPGPVFFKQRRIGKDKKDQQQQDKEQQKKEQQQPKMSRDNAEQLLNAAMQNEKATQERLKKAMQKPQRRSLQKNW